jgi:meso-butanediol dehydrogenase/(S,S)-butanediol dehydrogenase/diacetyl reductase
MRFTGKIALITGGGSVIGAATARRLAAGGASVALLGRTEATLQAVADEVVQAGGRALPVVCDVSSAEQVDAALAATVDAFGRLDIVVANAAVQLHGRDRPIDEMAVEDWDTTQAINDGGIFLTCRAGLRQLVKQGEGGCVVVVSSVMGLKGLAAHNPAYTTSKGSTIGLGQALAVQYAEHGIRCNVVCPGALEVPPDHELLGDAGLAAREARWQSLVPLGRTGRFAEIAPLICFLASDEASYITGAVIPVDGGLAARTG